MLIFPMKKKLYSINKHCTAIRRSCRRLNKRGKKIPRIVSMGVLRKEKRLRYSLFLSVFIYYGQECKFVAALYLAVNRKKAHEHR